MGEACEEGSPSHQLGPISPSVLLASPPLHGPSGSTNAQKIKIKKEEKTKRLSSPHPTSSVEVVVQSGFAIGGAPGRWRRVSNLEE